MKSRADHRIPGYSAADMAALRALTATNLALNQAAQDLARMVAPERGIDLQPPQSDQPRRRGRHRYGNIVWHTPADRGRNEALTKVPDGIVEADELETP